MMTKPSGDDRLDSTDTTSLSDIDLLALLVQHGGTLADARRRAQALLSSFGDWVGLHRATLDELGAVAAMGEANAASVKAALDVGRRQLLSGPTQPRQITAPGDIAALLQLEMAALEKEQSHVSSTTARRSTSPPRLSPPDPRTGRSQKRCCIIKQL